MRNTTRLLALTFLLVCTASAQTTKVDSILHMQEFVQDWKISKQFTLDLANSMPGESYRFQPNPEEMTFAEQMAHIADANVFRFEQITGIKPPYRVDFSQPSPSDKE